MDIGADRGKVTPGPSVPPHGTPTMPTRPPRLLLAGLLLVTLTAADWPTFLGPTRDNVSPEKGVLKPWPAGGLRKLWECDLGVGYAPPVVAGGKLFHFDRFGDACRVTARDAATGRFLWKYEYPTDYEDR